MASRAEPVDVRHRAVPAQPEEVPKGGEEAGVDGKGQVVTQHSTFKGRQGKGQGNAVKGQGNAVKSPACRDLVQQHLHDCTTPTTNNTTTTTTTTTNTNNDNNSNSVRSKMVVHVSHVRVPAARLDGLDARAAVVCRNDAAPSAAQPSHSLSRTAVLTAVCGCVLSSE